ncbi:hypothetical protein [uncultured Microbacterium sp.]|uniref:hypothetical protein n=1 Tax=uncultured Microbacterium sp. TaxID=191216 RepID=UPI0026190C06|nr:hypothetical protein [uncultured Microbacterium sp.]
MIVHPGDQLSWNDSTYQVCEVNEGYVVLRDTVTDVEREVASSVLEKTAVVPEIRRLSSLSDLRILKTLGKADRREVDVWLEELRAKAPPRMADFGRAGIANYVVGKLVNYGKVTGYLS